MSQEVETIMPTKTKQYELIGNGKRTTYKLNPTQFRAANSIAELNGITFNEYIRKILKGHNQTETVSRSSYIATAITRDLLTLLDAGVFAPSNPL